MLLLELFTKTTKDLRPWKDVDADERTKLLTGYLKNKSKSNPVSGEELERFFRSKGINVSRRSVDKELEKDKYREFDKARVKGTQYTTQLKNKKTVKESHELINLLEQLLDEADCPDCKKKAKKKIIK